MTELLVKAILAYLLGSMSGSMVLGAFRHVDIRNSGSGNAGGTNAFRTQGFGFALGVVLIDVGKGALAAGFLPALAFTLPGQEVSIDVQMLACGFAAVVGHCFPVWYGFRGGKGAATAVGALAMIQPVVLLPMIITWMSVLVLTGWVGLATMLAAISLVPAFYWLGASDAQWWFGIVLAFFIVVMHHSNLAKMINGTEHKFQRIRITNWFR